MRTMNQSDFQQDWERFEIFLFNSQSDDQKDLSLHFRDLFDFNWINVRQSQIVTNVIDQAVTVELKNSQAVFSSFDLSLNLADTEC